MIRLVFWQGKPAISKMRIPKAYRDPNLDQLLRTRRTRQEAELLNAAKLAGVDCPFIYFTDPIKSEIIMEFINGTLLKELSTKKETARTLKWYRKLGEYAARLHSKGIMHGDLTTKNVILSGERLVLIDFGLAFMSDRLEDRAEDVHLLKQAIRSSCEPSLGVPLIATTLKGYEEIAGEKQTRELEKQILEIEERGRYARVD